MAVQTHVFGGRHSETAAIRNALARSGVVAPHSGEPFSEAMLFGIGGGIGAGYWLFEYKVLSVPLLSVFTRHAWDSGARFLCELCEHLGVPYTLDETTSPKVAADRLAGAVAAGRQPIAWVDVALAPSHGFRQQMAGLIGAGSRAVGVASVSAEDGSLEIDDRAPVPWRTDAATFASARASVRSDKNRLLITELASEIDLASAIRAGIAACVRGMLSPPPGLPAWASANCGLAALAKWADLIANPKDRKGWPTVYPPGPLLYGGLARAFDCIETSGTGGGAFRLMYAEFLDEAGVALGDPRLGSAAARYREIGDQWRRLADALLPEAVAPFARTRTLLRCRETLLETIGAAAANDAAAINDELVDIEAGIAASFPLSVGAARDLLVGLQTRLREIHQAESAAVEDLAAYVG